MNENGNKRFAFTFEYNSPIGNKNVLSINNLSDNNKKNVKSVSRSKCVGENNIIVKTITGIELQPTNIIYVEILKTKQLPFFVITAFPECLANNIPDDELVFAM